MEYVVKLIDDELSSLKKQKQSIEERMGETWSFPAMLMFIGVMIAVSYVIADRIAPRTVVSIWLVGISTGILIGLGIKDKIEFREWKTKFSADIDKQEANLELIKKRLTE